jgi:anti-sigma-K factor RskA
MVDVHDLAAAYAIDALSGAERRRFERHVRACARCQEEVRVLAEGAADLADLAKAEPPVAMKARVMAAIATIPQDRPGPAVLRRQRRRDRRIWELVTAAAGIAVVVLAGSLIALNRDLEEARLLNSILTAPDLITVEIEGAISARFSYSTERSQGAFITSDLPLLEEARTYQLWLIGGSGPVSVGAFRPGQSGEATVVVSGRMGPGVALGLTEEPAGGSPQPTSEPLIVQPLA